MPPLTDGLYFLRSRKLDVLQWEACLAQSHQAIIYAHAWYLDAVCACWSAVVEVREGRYVSLFPLPEKRVAGLAQVYQPFFTQQLGLFTTPQSRFTQLRDYLDCLPVNYLRVYLQLNVHNQWAGGIKSTAFQVKQRLTYHLDLNQPYEKLYEAYRTNQKRNVHKNQAGCQLLAGDIDQLIALFRQTRGRQVAALKDKDYALLRRLYRVLQQRQAGQVLALWAENKLLATGLFLYSSRHIIYLFGASSAAGRQQGGMAKLLDQVIRQQAGSRRVLDFEGSDMASLAKFYANFGARPVPYITLKRTNIPFLPSWLNKKFLF